MSWLSDIFNSGGNSTTFTPSPNFENWATGGTNATAAAQATATAQAAADAKAAADAEASRVAAENEKSRLLGLRTSASGNALTSANKYFSDRGLDPNAYGGDINQRINDILSGVIDTDPNPGAAFGDVGADVYGRLNSAARDKASRSVDTAFTPGFEKSRIADTLDDPILGEVQKTQRGTADQLIQNMLKRGVITGTGASAATSSLDKQDPRVRAILDQVGGGVLEGGRDKLRGVADEARGAAAGTSLGQNFDVNKFTGEADNGFNDFLSKLSDSIKSQAPEGLYDTSGLASAAGAGQGAQNTKFDPKALSGILDPNPQPDETDPLKKSAASPF